MNNRFIAIYTQKQLFYHIGAEILKNLDFPKYRLLQEKKYGRQQN